MLPYVTMHDQFNKLSYGISNQPPPLGYKNYWFNEISVLFARTKARTVNYRTQ